MYIALMGCAQQGSSTPLSAAIDSGSLIDAADVADVATGSVVTFTTTAGDFAATIVASGGSGSYTYTWYATKNGENSDNNNRFSVASSGTTNAATYDTLTLNGARPGTGGGSLFEGEFLIRCEVSDGTDTVDVEHSFFLNGISI